MRRLFLSLAVCSLSCAAFCPDIVGNVTPTTVQHKNRLHGIGPEINLRSLAQYYKDSAITLARTMKKDWHKAESVAKELFQQTAAAAVGVSDSRISHYLNKKDYEDNAWVLAARFWQGQSADSQQLSIVVNIIRTKLHHKLSTIDKMSALSPYTLVLPHIVAEMTVRQRGWV